MLKNKSQIPNPKSQSNPKSQFPIAKFTRLVIGHWILIGYWILVIGISPLFAQKQESVRKIKRDPFIPLVTPDGRILKLKSEEQEEGLAIEGIVYDKAGLSYALVNGEPVKIGDRVGEYQVLKIQEHSVIFVKEGQTKEVELKKEAE